MENSTHNGALSGLPWDDDPLCCEVILSGSDDEYYESREARQQRYEVQARRFLDGKIPLIMTASLKGPFSKESGWRNPWRSRRATKPHTSPLRHHQNEEQHEVLSGMDPRATRAAKDAVEEGDDRLDQLLQVNHPAGGRDNITLNSGDTDGTSLLPVPGSQNSGYSSLEINQYMDITAFHRVQSWRDDVQFTAPAKERFWITETAKLPRSDWIRKRRSKSSAQSAPGTQISVSPTPASHRRHAGLSENPKSTNRTDNKSASRIDEHSLNVQIGDSSFSSIRLPAPSLDIIPPRKRRRRTQEHHASKRDVISEEKLSRECASFSPIMCDEEDNKGTLSQHRTAATADDKLPAQNSASDGDSPSTGNMFATSASAPRDIIEDETASTQRERVITQDDLPQEPLTLEDDVAAACDTHQDESFLYRKKIKAPQDELLSPVARDPDDLPEKKPDLHDKEQPMDNLSSDNSSEATTTLSSHESQLHTDETADTSHGLAPEGAEMVTVEHPPTGEAPAAHVPAASQIRVTQDRHDSDKGTVGTKLQFIQENEITTTDVSSRNAQEGSSLDDVTGTLIQPEPSLSAREGGEATRSSNEELSLQDCMADPVDTPREAVQHLNEPRMSSQSNTGREACGPALINHNIATSAEIQISTETTDQVAQQSPWTEEGKELYPEPVTEDQTMPPRKYLEDLELIASQAVDVLQSQQTPWAMEGLRITSSDNPLIIHSQSANEASQSSALPSPPLIEGGGFEDIQTEKAQMPSCPVLPSTPDTKHSSLPTPDFTLSIKSFANFMSPSPPRPQRPKRVSSGSGRLPSTQNIIDVALSNPWIKTPATKSARRVSFAPLPSETVDTEDDANKENEGADESGRELSGFEDGASISKRRKLSRHRAASPPLPGSPSRMSKLDGKFAAHFEAMTRRKKPRLGRSLLPSASQQVLSSPSVGAMAEAFLEAGQLRAQASSGDTDTNMPGADDVHGATMETQSTDDVSDVMHNIDDYINAWDIDAELASARPVDGDGASTSRVSGQQVSMLSTGFGIGVWGN